MNRRDEQIIAILNAEQKSAWDKLQGKKFEFSMRPGQGAPGVPGGGQRGGQRGGGGGIGDG